MKNRHNNLFPAIKTDRNLSLYDNSGTGDLFSLRHRLNLNIIFNGVRSVNVTSDSRYLIITFESNEGRIRIVDLKKLEFLPDKYLGHTDSVRLTSITKDNKSFYTASWDGTARRFDISTGKCTQIFGGFGRSPSCFLDIDQKYLFTASYDSDYDIDSKNAGRCWDVISGKIINVYKHTVETCKIESIDIAFDKENVYTGSDDGIAYKWNLKGKKPVLKYFSFNGSVRKIAVSKNYLAAACTDGHVRIHNKYSGEYFKYFVHGKVDVRDVRISKDETKIWSAADDGSVKCYNLKTGKVIYHKFLHSNWIWSICLMNDEKILVTGSSDSSIVFLSAESGQILARLINVLNNKDFLITCPPDKTFPDGFFYTTNKNYIEVDIRHNKRAWKRLQINDPKREDYIRKLNLKNLVITRLKNDGQYNALTEQYIQNQKALNYTAASHKSFRLLNA